MGWSWIALLLLAGCVAAAVWAFGDLLYVSIVLIVIGLAGLVSLAHLALFRTEACESRRRSGSRPADGDVSCRECGGAEVVIDRDDVHKSPLNPIGFPGVGFSLSFRHQCKRCGAEYYEIFPPLD